MRKDVLWLGVAIVGALLIHPGRAGAGPLPTGCAPAYVGGSPALPPGYYPYPQQAMQAVPARQPILPRRPALGNGFARNGGTQQSAAQGKVRLQNDEEPRASLPPLPIPSPEELGLAAKPSASQEVNWTAVRRRLDNLSATSFHLQRTPGGFRFSCIVPDRSGERHRIEAEAMNESEAIDRALAQAEAGT